MKAVAIGPVLAAYGFLLGVGPATSQTAPTNPWRDLNHNGRMDPYENPRLPVERRVDDLIARMTIEEKLGMLVHGNLPTTPDSPIGQSATGYDLARVAEAVEQRHVNSFITRLVLPPSALAEQNNAVQKIAERTRLGIPVTISSDPRHHFQATLGASTTGGDFSLWPDTLGFAAIGDTDLMQQFGNIARQEYRAVGIHMALSPQADIGIEPRWARFGATFGSDPALISRLAGAYVAGFQGGRTGVRKDGVATIVKHWVGYGAEPEGFDGHNYYGRNVRLNDAEFARHVRAFDGALAVKSAGVMPTYVIVQGPKIAGKPLEAVGAGFSKQLLTDLLRRQKGFGGLIVSDWAITNDCPMECRAPDAANPQTPRAIGMPWGVEGLSKAERFAKGINAGVDQFGGVDDPAPILAAVRAGRVRSARVDASVRRILRLKFELGLFDQPYVDAAAAARIVGQPSWRAEAERTQSLAQVVLTNRGAFPLKAGSRIWLFGADPAAARAAGYSVVNDPADADVALIRASTPFETLHPHHFFGSRQHEGRLDFREDDPAMKALARAAAHVPAILAVEMDRPADVSIAKPLARAILIHYGASDAALFAVLSGKVQPVGRLPFVLPQGETERK